MLFPYITIQMHSLEFVHVFFALYFKQSYSRKQLLTSVWFRTLV